MKVRLVVSINAAPGKGAELAQAFRQRCTDVAKEPGCEQFEVFQSVLNPDKFTLLELWSDQAALDVHAKVNLTRAPMPPGLRAEGSSREDYQYSRTRANRVLAVPLGPWAMPELAPSVPTAAAVPTQERKDLREKVSRRRDACCRMGLRQPQPVPWTRCRPLLPGWGMRLSHSTT